MKLNENLQKYLAPIMLTGMNFENKDLSFEAFMKDKILKLCPNLKDDGNGNLYLLNPNTPLICAHMDNVGTAEAQKHLSDMKIYTEEDKNGNPIQVVRGTHNIGADDKCGIIMALGLYESLGDKVSLLFTYGEETGGHGIKAFLKSHSKELVENCNYAIVPDRRNSGDFIGVKNNYCTKEFETEVLSHISSYGFAGCSGSFSDCNSLKLHMNAFNISVGYYSAHTDKEHFILEEFENTFLALEHLIQNFNKKMDKPVEIEYDFYKTSSRFGYTNYYTDTNSFFNLEATEDEISKADYYFKKPVILVHHNGAEYKLPAGAYTIKKPKKTIVKTKSPFGVLSTYQKTENYISPSFVIGDVCPNCGDNDYAGRNILANTTLQLEQEKFSREILYCPCCGFMVNKWGVSETQYIPMEVNTDDIIDNIITSSSDVKYYDFTVFDGERYIIYPDDNAFKNWYPHCPYCFGKNVSKYYSSKYTRTYKCTDCNSTHYPSRGYTLVKESTIDNIESFVRDKSIPYSDILNGLYNLNK